MKRSLLIPTILFCISRRKKRQPPGITIITARDNYYYRIRNKTGSGWQVTDYPASGTLALKGLQKGRP
jgi:hypothetical protein